MPAAAVSLGVVMRDINLVSNRVWSKFFRTQINMKGEESRSILFMLWGYK